MNEPDSLEALRQGDEQAFTRLVARHHRPIVQMCRAIVGDSAAEEVAQEAWISIHRALPDFAGRSSLKTWLYRIARNAALSRLRRQRREVSLDGLLEAAGTDDPSALMGGRFNSAGRWSEPPGHWGGESVTEVLEGEELQHCISRAIEALEPVRRAVLLMRDLEQLSFGDICNTLGISHSNARVLLHRARLAVHSSIEHYRETGEC